MISDIDDIFKWCVVNKEIRSICDNDLFWKDKLNLSYPGYVGNLYKKSYKKTVKILYYGKTIKYNDSATMKLYGNASVYNIAEPEYSWELRYWNKFKGGWNVLEYVSKSKKFYSSSHILNAINSGYTLLYTILLPGVIIYFWQQII